MSTLHQTKRWKHSEKIHKLTYLALMTALVVFLQYAGQFVRIGMFQCAMVLVPVVLGAALCGVGAGAWLGFVFSAMVFITHDADAFLAVSVPGTIITVFAKGIACGAVSGLLFTLLKKVHLTVATIVAAVACPLVNTGIFLLGCVFFFYDTVSVWAASLGFASGAEYMFLGLAGGNFLLEFSVNLVLCPVLIRLLQLLNKRHAVIG